MLATDNWCIKVAQRVYGPYTQDQMSDFAAEGRLSGQSLVAPAGGKMWREARQYPTLAALLDGKKPEAKAFGRSKPVAETAALPEGAVANFIVIFDVVSGAASRLSHVLSSLGPAFRVADNVWSVATSQTALGVKNALAPHMQLREPIMVIDCSRGRTAWQNFTPELHARLLKAWTKVGV
jgi:hypothetical protein